MNPMSLNPRELARMAKEMAKKLGMTKEGKDVEATMDEGEQSGTGWGNRGPLNRFVRNAIENAIDLTPLLKSTIRRMISKVKLDNFVELNESPPRLVSPVPIRLNKKEAFLISQGVWPPLFRRYPKDEGDEDVKSLVIYMDVSGSAYHLIPQMCGIIKAYEKQIKRIFVFSTEVRESDVPELLAGNYYSTGGTSFDQVARHINENEYDKAIIITDGFCSFRSSHVALLEAEGFKAITLLFGSNADFIGDGNASEDQLRRASGGWSKFGDVIPMNDVPVEGF